MTIEPVDLHNSRQVKHFIDLPFHIYRQIPQWVPPLLIDARRMLDEERNPFFKHSQAGFWLARDAQGQAIGRLAVLNNRNYNNFNQEHTAFFYLFECIDSQDVATALFDAGCSWAHKRGLNRILGPKGFTPLDGLGMLSDGFQHRPAFGLPYNPAYYLTLIQSCGFSMESELVSGYINRATNFPQQIHQVAESVMKRRGLHIAQFPNRSSLRMLVPQLKDLYNGSLGGTQGNTPLTDEEARILADQLLWFADPRLIKIVMKDDQPVGFLFAYPDVSAGLQRSHGKLFPLGWLILLIELRRTRWININGAGMIEGYRGLGGTALLFSEMAKTLEGVRFQHADVVQIGAENDRMLRELREIGILFYKKHRLYQKPL